MCGSDNFMIEKQFALLKVIAQGGFGNLKNKKIKIKNKIKK